MIIQETLVINNRTLKHTYSSENKYIKQLETGVIYDEAYDTLKYNYNYVELDQEIEKEIPPEDVPQE